MSAVTASLDTLMDQASATAYSYMLHTVHNIDQTFGEGYAKAHPALVGAMVQAASHDFVGSLLRQGLDDLADTIAAPLDKIGNALGDPFFSESNLTDALNEVALAIAASKDK